MTGLLPSDDMWTCTMNHRVTLTNMTMNTSRIGWNEEFNMRRHKARLPLEEKEERKTNTIYEEGWKKKGDMRNGVGK